MEERKYQFSGTAEDFRQIIITMKADGLLGETGAGLDNPSRKQVADRRGSFIKFGAFGRDGTTVLTVVGDDGRTWELVQDYIRTETPWKIQHVPGRTKDSRMHPYRNPATIKNKRHQYFVQLLIDQALGRNTMTNEEIMKEMRWGTSNFYKYRRQYMATEAEEVADSI